MSFSRWCKIDWPVIHNTYVQFCRVVFSLIFCHERDSLTNDWWWCDAFFSCIIPFPLQGCVNHMVNHIITLQPGSGMTVFLDLCVEFWNWWNIHTPFWMYYRISCTIWQANTFLNIFVKGIFFWKDFLKISFFFVSINSIAFKR